MKDARLSTQFYEHISCGDFNLKYDQHFPICWRKLRDKKKNYIFSLHFFYIMIVI